MLSSFDQLAHQLEWLLDTGPRLVVIGSTSFWHPESAKTCEQIGLQLATIPDLVLITGGVEGVGEAIGRSFYRASKKPGVPSSVYHILPEGEPTWDYGQTLFAGWDMRERREVLGRLSQLYLAVEGGPGTVHEAEVASARGAVILPVGRSGGFSAELYARMNRPLAVEPSIWEVLGSARATPEEIGLAVLGAVRSCLGSGRR